MFFTFWKTNTYYLKNDLRDFGRYIKLSQIVREFTRFQEKKQKLGNFRSF